MHDAREAVPLTGFADVGAVVYYLKAIPWQIPDFSVDLYFDRLKELERRARTEGCIVVRGHRFLLDATKPASKRTSEDPVPTSFAEAVF